MIQTVFFSTMVKDNITANLIAACPDGIIGVDLRGTVVIFNAKAAALTQRNLPEQTIAVLQIFIVPPSKMKKMRFCQFIPKQRQLLALSLSLTGKMSNVFQDRFQTMNFSKGLTPPIQWGGN